MEFRIEGIIPNELNRPTWDNRRQDFQPVDRFKRQAEGLGLQLHLPVDVLIAQELSNKAETKIQGVEAGVPADWKILDVGPESVSLFGGIIRQAKTVLWNGPMGVFEIPAFANGTQGVSQALAEATDGGALTIIGGGDSAAAVQQFRLGNRMSHISTGGGASLKFLEGRELPGVSVIPERKD